MFSIRTIAMVVFVLLSGATYAQSVAKLVKVSGDTIVAFLPTFAEASKDDAAIEAVEHVRFALNDTLKCLGTKRVSSRIVFADQLVVTFRGRTYTFDLKGKGQGVGALLFSEKKPPRHIFTTMGPSGLQYTLPTEAGEYYEVSTCKVG